VHVFRRFLGNVSLVRVRLRQRHQGRNKDKGELKQTTRHVQIQHVQSVWSRHERVRAQHRRLWPPTGSGECCAGSRHAPAPDVEEERQRRQAQARAPAAHDSHRNEERREARRSQEGTRRQVGQSNWRSCRKINNWCVVIRLCIHFRGDSTLFDVAVLAIALVILVDSSGVIIFFFCLFVCLG
jgi:hypothetical protein